MADPLDGLERWLADARAEEARDARVRERWLRAQDLESATLAGIAAGLAEDGAVVVVTVRDGRHHVGTVSMVGSDFLVVVHRGQERATLVAMVAVASIGLVDAAASTPRAGLDGTASAGEPVSTAGAGESGSTASAGEPGSTAGASEFVSTASAGESVSMASVLDRGAAERRRVTLRAGGNQMAGDLVAVGADVVTLRTDGEPPRLAYVSLSSVSEVSFFDSG